MEDVLVQYRRVYSACWSNWEGASAAQMWTRIRDRQPVVPGEASESTCL